MKNNQFKRGKYRHYKGNFYEVIDTATHSEDESLLVLYKPLYNENGENEDKKLWVRPYDMFFEKIIVDGKECQRFTFVSTTV